MGEKIKYCKCWIVFILIIAIYLSESFYLKLYLS